MDEDLRVARYEQPVRSFDDHKKPLSRSASRSPSPPRNREPSPLRREQQNGRRVVEIFLPNF